MHSHLTNSQPPDAAETKTTEAGDSSKPTPSTGGRRLRILLAEDNEINQKVATCLLENRGHSVKVAENGLVALSCLEAEHFDLVVMDVQMPEMSGFDATAAIREKESKTGTHIPIVAMTAHAMKGDRERCLAAGMDAYIPKPIQPAELFRTIESLISPDSHPGPTAEESQSITEMPGNQLLEHSALLASVGGNAEMLVKIVRLFMKRYPTLLSEIRDAATQGDRSVLARAAHTLKGGGGAFLTKHAVETLTRLVAMGREGNLTDVDAAVIDLEREMTLIDSQLAALVTEGTS
jgi:CheY-like chemotaxis protein